MITFEIPGIPQQQGSKRHVGRGIMIEANKNLAPWRDSAIWHAREAAQSKEPIACEITVRATFYFPRPKSHYRTGRHAGKLKPTAPLWMTTAPDLDKLCRALGDALTQSGLILDDRYIARWVAAKGYDSRPWTSVQIAEHYTREWAQLFWDPEPRPASEVIL